MRGKRVNIDEAVDKMKSAELETFRRNKKLQDNIKKLKECFKKNDGFGIIDILREYDKSDKNWTFWNYFKYLLIEAIDDILRVKIKDDVKRIKLIASHFSIISTSIGYSEFPLILAKIKGYKVPEVDFGQNDRPFEAEIASLINDNITHASGRGGDSYHLSVKSRLQKIYDEVKKHENDDKKIKLLIACLIKFSMEYLAVFQPDARKQTWINALVEVGEPTYKLKNLLKDNPQNDKKTEEKNIKIFRYEVLCPELENDANRLFNKFMLFDSELI